MRTRASRCACLLIVLAGCGLFGQQPREDTSTRSLQGIVTDASGNIAAKAVVKLKDTKTLQIQSFITSADGSYHFVGLSTEIEYEVKADHADATSGWKKLSVFNTKKVATINLKLNK
ncbi:MAG: carboxypeptidase-like regulatory domain-containing protein [Acidobacteriia bacterium]|nr:carboxypeptidase-like regulatory domain-containing protein [Terriglobia bacterium]